jgi:two-component system C4-dicarboxylate transport sensor histidine kinase DctB
VKTEGVDEPITILANPTELFQVFANILKNALEAVQGQEAPWLRVVVEKDLRVVHVRIGDSGKSPGVLPVKSSKGEAH